MQSPTKEETQQLATQNGKPKPKVSVSVVLYKTAPEEVRLSLAGLASASVPLHITVVDNSPTDALRTAVEGSGAEYIFSGDNRGFGAGHNIALRKYLAEVPYHLVMNADVDVPSGTLEELANYMDAHPGVGLVMPKVCFPDDREQPQARHLPTPVTLIVRRLFRRETGSRSSQEPAAVPFLSGCFMLLRGSVLEKSGLFDERFFLYMEDVDLSRRIGDFAETVFYPGAKIYHHHARASYKNFRMLGIHLASAYKYFRKWGWFLDKTRRERNRAAGRPVGKN